MSGTMSTTRTLRSPLCRGLALAALVACVGASRDLSAQDVRRETRVFPVASIIRPPMRGDDIVAVRPELRRRAWLEAEAVIQLDDFDGSRASSGLAWLDADSLIDLIQSRVAEDSWENDRNSIEVELSRLIVRQTPEVLDRVGRLLAALERRLAHRSWVDVAIVPSTAWRRAVAASGGDTRELVQPGAVLDAALRESGDAGRLLSGLARAGEPLTLRSADVRRHVVDHDVNQTGVTPVVGPVLRNVPSGLFARAVVRRLPVSGWVRLDLQLGQVELRSDARRRDLPRGEIDLIDHDERALSTSLPARSGRAAVAGSLWIGSADEEAADAVDQVVVVRVREPELPALIEVAALDTSSLLSPLPESSLARYRDAWLGMDHDELYFDVEESDGEAPRAPTLVPREALITGLEADLGTGLEELLDGAGPVWTAAGARGLDAASSRLEQVTRESARWADVEVRQVSLSPAELEALGGVGGVLAEDAEWPVGREGGDGFACRALGAAGARFSLGATSAKGYVADVEHVSGGTGFAILEVSDIIVESVAGGLVLDVRAEPVPGTSWILLHVRGGAATPPRLERRSKVRDTHRVAIEEDTAGDTDRVQPIGEWIEVDLPDRRIDRIEHLATVVDGRPLILGARPDPDHPGHLRVLIARARLIGLPSDDDD